VGVYSDLMMHLGRRAFLKKASTNNAAWGFYFTQTPPPATLDLDYEYPGEPLAWQKRVGTYHGSELPYVFGEVTNVKGATVGDGSLTETVMRAWIQFTYYLNPNGPQDQAVTGDLYWPKYNATQTGEVMYLQNQGGMTSGARPDIMRQKVYDAWNDAMVSLGKAAIY
jgi:carboxylesterase type B